MPEARPSGEVSMTKGSLAGLCLTVFSLGMFCSFAIYRYAPRFRPEYAGPVTIAAGDVAAKPVAEPPAAAVADPVPAPPSVAPATPPAPAARVAAPPVPAPRAAATTRSRHAAHAAAAPAAAAPAPQAKGRATVQKRPAASPGPGNDSLPPTEGWSDPFSK
jgi:hypothetical protein